MKKTIEKFLALVTLEKATMPLDTDIATHDDMISITQSVTKDLRINIWFFKTGLYKVEIESMSNILNFAGLEESMEHVKTLLNHIAQSVEEAGV